MWLSAFGGCILCSLFGQFPKIVLYIPTYLKLPVVFLFGPFLVGKCKSFLVETNPGNQIPTTIRFAVLENRWSSLHPLVHRLKLLWQFLHNPPIAAMQLTKTWGFYILLWCCWPRKLRRLLGFTCIPS